MSTDCRPLLGFFPSYCINFYKNAWSRKWYLLGTKKNLPFCVKYF